MKNPRDDFFVKATVSLVLGGAASGKSAFAQHLAEQHPGPLLYVATAQVGDAEMAERIARHRQARDHRWQTLEAPVDLTGLVSVDPGHGAILVDCITLWLTNLLLSHESVEQVWAAVEAFVATFDSLPAPLLLVSNEVGQGIVPENALARTFRDLAGGVNQRLAAVADHVWLVTAGLPLPLKGP